jgi:hypothetical protein
VILGEEEKSSHVTEQVRYVWVKKKIAIVGDDESQD